MFSCRRLQSSASFNRSETALLLLSLPSRGSGVDISIEENTRQVDGIGGTTWDGSLLLCELLLRTRAALTECTLLELGCGSGLCGICIAADCAVMVTTDQEIDLVQQNLYLNPHDNLSAVSLQWGEELGTLSDQHWDVLFGAEITCLKSQHGALVDTIDRLVDDRTIVLLTFDESWSNSGDIVYKRSFIEGMTNRGFEHEPILDGEVSWRKKKGDKRDSLTEFNAVVKTRKPNAMSCVPLDFPIDQSTEDDETGHKVVSFTRHHIEVFFRRGSRSLLLQHLLSGR